MRLWRVTVTVNGATREQQFRVSSYNPLIARMEVLAQLIENERPATLAFRDSGGIRRLLADDVRLRQVDLHRAAQVLAGMEAKRSFGSWVLLTRTPDP